MLARVGGRCAASKLSRLNRTLRKHIGLSYSGPFGQEAVRGALADPLLLQLDAIELLLCEECSIWSRRAPPAQAARVRYGMPSTQRVPTAGVA
jgi:hypothetical protein